jgi:chromosome segregation ATPase
MSNEVSNEVLVERLEQVRTDIRSLARNLSEVTSALKHVPLMRQDISNLSAELKKMEERVNTLEESVADIQMAMPGLKEVRKYATMAVIAIMALVGGALLNQVIVSSPPRAAVAETK